MIHSASHPARVVSSCLASHPLYLAAVAAVAADCATLQLLGKGGGSCAAELLIVLLLLLLISSPLFPLLFSVYKETIESLILFQLGVFILSSFCRAACTPQLARQRTLRQRQC